MTTMVNKAEQLIAALSLIQPKVAQHKGEPVLDMAAAIKQSIAQHGLLSVLMQDSTAMADKSFRSTLLVLPSENKHPQLPAGSVITAKLNTALAKGAVLIIRAEQGQLIVQAPNDSVSRQQQLQVAHHYHSNQTHNQTMAKPALISQTNQLLAQLPTAERRALIQVLQQPSSSVQTHPSARQSATSTIPASLASVREQVSLVAGFTRASLPSPLAGAQSASNTAASQAPLSQLASVLQWLLQQPNDSKASNLLPQLLSALPKQTQDLLAMKAATMAQQGSEKGQPLLNLTNDRPEQRLPQLLNSLLQHQTVAQLQHSAINLQTDPPQLSHWLPFFHQHMVKEAQYDLEPLPEREQGERYWRLKVYFTLPPLASICAELRFKADQLAITLWSETPQTLQLLQAHSETLQALISNHVRCEQLSCQYGMPPKRQRPEPPQQQVDIKA